MAYEKADMLKKALAVIPAEECVTMEEVVLFLPCGKTTFYALGLNESNEIKEAIEAQKVAIKKKMRRNWRNSDNATLQIEEYKLISTEAELERLNTSKVNNNVTISKPGIKLVIGAEDTDEDEDDNG